MFLVHQHSFVRLTLVPIFLAVPFGDNECRHCQAIALQTEQVSVVAYMHRKRKKKKEALTPI
jgi:hypothetical protein